MGVYVHTHTCVPSVHSGENVNELSLLIVQQFPPKLTHPPGKFLKTKVNNTKELQEVPETDQIH